MRGSEFTRAAGTWAVATGSTEPVWRSSVSRAYYGAMHHCCEFLLDVLKIQCARNTTRHEKVPLALSKSGNPELKAASLALGGLSSNRKKADYDILDARCNSSKDAQFAVQQAKDIEAKLAVCAQSGNLRAIQQAMAAHIQPSGLLSGWTVVAQLP